MPDGAAGALSVAPSIEAEDIRAIIVDPSRIALVAQPIVDLARAVVVGYEALARFSLGKPAPPDKVFAAAVRAGLGAELEAVVIERALALSAAKPPNCFLTINVDPLHIVAPQVSRIIDAHGNLGGLIFELTEHHSIDDLRGIRHALDRLKERGAFIAIDDAGAGYAGLKQILELQPQLLKVDRDLITNVHSNEAKRALIQMLGELASRLDAWLLAEGIETEAELNALCQLGVPLGQGYFLGRPAAPWSSLDGKAEQLIAKRPRFVADVGPTLEGLVEPCTVCDESSAWPEPAKVVVRLDRAARPIAMRLQSEEGGRHRTFQELLRVKRGDALADVGLRAATRAERLRWDPLVCVDERGSFEGVIPMQRLVCALANAAKSGGTAVDSTSARLLDVQTTTRH